MIMARTVVMVESTGMAAMRTANAIRTTTRRYG
jgi:hypothetical protein